MLSNRIFWIIIIGVTVAYILVIIFLAIRFRRSLFQLQEKMQRLEQEQAAAQENTESEPESEDEILTDTHKGCRPD